MKRIYFILMFLGTFSSLLAQKKERNNLFINLDFSYGAVLPEYQFIHAYVTKNIQQVELSVLKSTYGTNFWQKKYAFPKFGFSTYFSTLGSKSVLGNEIALYPYIMFTSSPKNKFHFKNKFGLGLGFATKKFDLKTNYENIAVGSHLNVHFTYQTGLEYELNSKTKINSCLNFHHFSNANMEEPNLGINTLSFSLGLTKAISKLEENLNPEIPVFEKGNEFVFIYSAGGKHTRALQSDVFFTSSISTEWNRKASHLFHFGFGLDLFYDSSGETEISVKKDATFKKSYDFQSGIHFAQEIVYNKFSFILQEGIYIGLTDKIDNSFIYNRAILRYKWSKHFFNQVAVKTHLHILDYPEFGFSYYF